MKNVLHIFPRQTGSRNSHVTIPKRFAYFWEVSAFISKQHNVESIDGIQADYSTYAISKKMLADNFRCCCYFI